MCCCAKPNVNGTPNAYSWDGKSYMTREPMPPALAEGDELLWDEPGRCGGLDAHSHHFRLVKGRYGFTVLERSGAGDVRVPLGATIARLAIPSLDVLSSDARYWLLHMITSLHCDTVHIATQETEMKWRRAAAEKRIKTRKRRNHTYCKVWIEPAKPPLQHAPVAINP